MKRLSIVIVALALGLVWPPSAQASNATAKREGLSCTACHDKPGSKLLTSEGKYYELMRTLDGYQELMAEFGSCTSCHVRKPGSKKLTENGKRFLWMMEDMSGLKSWLEDLHPIAPAEPEADDSPPAEAQESTPEVVKP